MSDYYTIKTNCLRRRQLWEDPEFRAEQKSIFYKRVSGMPNFYRVVWKRPGVSTKFVNLNHALSLSIVDIIAARQRSWREVIIQLCLSVHREEVSCDHCPRYIWPYLTGSTPLCRDIRCLLPYPVQPPPPTTCSNLFWLNLLVKEHPPRLHKFKHYEALMGGGGGRYPTGMLSCYHGYYCYSRRKT